MEASCLSCGNPKQTYLWVGKRSPYPKHVTKKNAFHLRGLRSILGLETTFVNRRNTNEFVLRTASEHAGQQIRAALAGHILRTHEGDPLRQVTYAPSSASGFPIGKSRVGGPKQQWRHCTHNIWDNFSDERTEYENTERQNQMYQMARTRKF